MFALVRHWKTVDRQKSGESTSLSKHPNMYFECLILVIFPGFYPCVCVCVLNKGKIIPQVAFFSHCPLFHSALKMLDFFFFSVFLRADLCPTALYRNAVICHHSSETVWHHTHACTHSSNVLIEDFFGASQLLCTCDMMLFLSRVWAAFSCLLYSERWWIFKVSSAPDA